jgi:hypothetical protein
MSTNENAMSAFEMLHDSMMDFVNKSTEQGYIEAGRIASRLLTYPELPILFRIRSHIALAYGPTHYLWHARKAVELVEQGRTRLGEGDTESEKAGFSLLVAEAQHVLDSAEADDEELQRKIAEWTAEGRVILGPEDEDLPGTLTVVYKGKVKAKGKTEGEGHDG